MTRVLTLIRVQLVGWPNVLGWPWLLFAMIFGVNYAVFRTLAEALDVDGPGGPKTGALSAIYIILFIASFNSITQLFPFAMALSIIRRTFYLAVSLLLVAQSVVFGTVLFLCKLIEDATDGWGLGLRFFGLGFLAQDNPVLQILVYTVPFIMLGFLGICTAILYKRWGMSGMFMLATAKVGVIGALAVLATWQQWWHAIGQWLGDQSSVALLAGWPALLALVLAGTGYLTIRRVTP